MATKKSRRKRKKVDKDFKKETFQEYLARGGKVQIIPPKEQEQKEITVRRTTSSPAQIMTLDEGAFFFSEKTKRKKKQKQVDKKEVDYWSKFLPEDVKNKLGL